MNLLRHGLPGADGLAARHGGSAGLLEVQSDHPGPALRGEAFHSGGRLIGDDTWGMAGVTGAEPPSTCCGPGLFPGPLRAGSTHSGSTGRSPFDCRDALRADGSAAKGKRREWKQ